MTSSAANWPTTLDLGGNDKDSYLSTLTAYLASHPPGSLAPSTQSLSSPEGSDGSSPSSSDGAGANPAPAATNTQSGHAPAPTDKRKVEPKVTAALKDRRASNGAEPVDGIHTHPDAFDDDDDNSPEDGTRGKGGKTSDRRRAQNRQAQRAFRERKEKASSRHFSARGHLKELEDRVFSLEQQTTDQVTENAALKQLLERLQGENERLKVYESAFSFTYAKDVSASSSMPTSTQFGGKPPTPPTVQDELDDLSAFELPAFSAGSNPFANSQLFPSSTAPFALPSPSALATGSGLDESLFLNSLSAPSPCSTTGGDSTSGSSANLSTPPELSNDLFSAYRDASSFGLSAGDNGTLAAYPDFDSLFGPVTSEADLEPNYSAFIASPSPSASAAPPQKPSTTSTPVCNGEKFSFDVDGLCSELKAKAVCQDHARRALEEAMREDAAAFSMLSATSQP